MKNWDSIELMFHSLHKEKLKYIILRNYEEIDADNFYTDGHADIDFLTEDPFHFANVIDAVPRFIENDGIHYIVMIAGVEVVIDVRSVGDGYYDKRWEKCLLENRILFHDRFFIADRENYYYSLVYHAILQKKNVSDDYLKRLNSMASSLEISAENENEHLFELELFMKKNGYRYTWPFDIHVPFRHELVDSHLVKKQFNVVMRDFRIGILKSGSKIKRFIFR